MLYVCKHTYREIELIIEHPPLTHPRGIQAQPFQITSYHLPSQHPHPATPAAEHKHQDPDTRTSPRPPPPPTAPRWDSRLPPPSSPWPPCRGKDRRRPAVVQPVWKSTPIPRRAVPPPCPTRDTKHHRASLSVGGWDGGGPMVTYFTLYYKEANTRGKGKKGRNAHASRPSPRHLPHAAGLPSPRAGQHAHAA